MNDRDVPTDQFERYRPHLLSVAHRLLGSVNEAEDAVQEAWVRASVAGTGGVDNLGGWLTTVVARVSLNMLRSRATRREGPMDETPEPPAREDDGGDPERETLLADSVGLAMTVVLDHLTPAERLAFVLHDMFAVPYKEIAVVLGRSPDAARQLASRGRRRVQGAAPSGGEAVRRRKEIVDAFLAASRGGDFAALLALLDPDAVLSADAAAVLTGAPELLEGATAVAETFCGRAFGARPALLGGSPGAVWAPGGRPQMAFAFTVHDATIARIEMIADPDRLAGLLPTSFRSL
ncbi:sigma-70 family RNA polymerase sigma factor [Actinomadura sp. 7K507]|uniref:sigma-70 family RNA polymerase sigma factor n=1 Tax=Actinomadura sp. 7K507 TaxID=2530365 RepID=UPI00104E0A25|nr:sigma-70 family RNA polymerase sigma factor [Actinomadura sp. 7K507]TDC90225.1 sigma-70 family RNA polymerase sigma factor [Actinomadura sp. 7K507]